MAWKGIGNVHSLLSQLQEIEYALSNLMIETILKIQTLTETKVFLLLENSNTKSRRYCGNKEMIENFEKSNFPLAPNCVDLEVRLDPKANILTERRRGNRKRRMNESVVDESLPQTELLSIRHSSSKRVFRVDENDEHLGSYDDNDQVIYQVRPSSGPILDKYVDILPGRPITRERVPQRFCEMYYR